MASLDIECFQKNVQYLQVSDEMLFQYKVFTVGYENHTLKGFSNKTMTWCKKQ